MQKDTTRLFVFGFSNDMDDQFRRDHLIKVLSEQCDIELDEKRDIMIIRDRETGNLRSFCFIEVPNNASDHVISTLDSIEFDGIKLTVKVAQPKPSFDRNNGGDRGNQRFNRRENRYNDNNDNY